jgi:phosphohistidine phosphatase
MPRLLLMRHAKTEREAPSGKDRDRRLEERGRSDATAIGHWLKAEKLVPDLALVSSAVRARQTWEQVSAQWPGPEAEIRDDLYMVETGDLLAIIRSAAGENPACLMIVAHNPALHEIAIALTGTGAGHLRAALMDNFPTGAVAVLDFESPDWGDVAFRRGHLRSFITPKRLRDEA